MLLIALAGCKETPMNTELKPFDVQKDFADNGFTFFTKNLILCSGDTTENNAMTIGWGSIGNYIGHGTRTRTTSAMPHLKTGTLTSMPGFIRFISAK